VKMNLLKGIYRTSTPPPPSWVDEKQPFQDKIMKSFKTMGKSGYRGE